MAAATSGAVVGENVARVAEVAADVGYESEAAFSRAFRREFGLPPGQYIGVIGRPLQKPATKIDETSQRLIPVRSRHLAFAIRDMKRLAIAHHLEVMLNGGFQLG